FLLVCPNTSGVRGQRPLPSRDANSWRFGCDSARSNNFTDDIGITSVFVSSNIHDWPCHPVPTILSPSERENCQDRSWPWRFPPCEQPCSISLACRCPFFSARFSPALPPRCLVRR